MLCLSIGCRRGFCKQSAVKAGQKTPRSAAIKKLINDNLLYAARKAMVFMVENGAYTRRRIAVAGMCCAAKLRVFEELTGSFVCTAPEWGLRGVVYYKRVYYHITLLPPDASPQCAADYDCVVCVVNPFELQKELFNALCFLKYSRGFVLYIASPLQKAPLPVELIRLASFLRVSPVRETRKSAKGINRLLCSIRRETLSSRGKREQKEKPVYMKYTDSLGDKRT